LGGKRKKYPVSLFLYTHPQGRRRQKEEERRRKKKERSQSIPIISCQTDLHQMQESFPKFHPKP
jgi:hypothetical protein